MNTSHLILEAVERRTRGRRRSDHASLPAAALLATAMLLIGFVIGVSL